MPSDSKRFPIVPGVSSSARMPLPRWTSMRAVTTRSLATSLHRGQLGGDIREADPGTRLTHGRKDARAGHVENEVVRGMEQAKSDGAGANDLLVGDHGNRALAGDVVQESTDAPHQGEVRLAARPIG